MTNVLIEIAKNIFALPFFDVGFAHAFIVEQGVFAYKNAELLLSKSEPAMQASSGNFFLIVPDVASSVATTSSNAIKITTKINLFFFVKNANYEKLTECLLGTISGKCRAVNVQNITTSTENAVLFMASVLGVEPTSIRQRISGYSLAAISATVSMVQMPQSPQCCELCFCDNDNDISLILKRN